MVDRELILLSLSPIPPDWEIIGEGGGRLWPIEPRRKCILGCALDTDDNWPAKADEGGACADIPPPTVVADVVGGGIWAFERRDTEGEELDGEDMVFDLNGLRLGLRIGSGLVEVVGEVIAVMIGFVVEDGVAVLAVKKGPWLIIELDGDEFKDNLRCSGESVGEGEVAIG